jgi:hypothetical protein
METDKIRKKYGDDFVNRWMSSRMKTRQDTRNSQPVRDMRKINTNRARLSSLVKKSFHEDKLREEVWQDVRMRLVQEWAGPKKAFAAGGAKIIQGKNALKKEINHEIVTPVRSLRRAVKQRIESSKVGRGGNLLRARTMRRRANAVLLNRTVPLAAAAAGAGAGVAVPFPGSAETGALVASKQARRMMKRFRGRIRPK